MTPQRHLTLAGIAMAIGITPLLLACAFVALNLATDWQTDPRHEALALAMFLSVLFSWVFGLACAVPASIWSYVVARRHPELTAGRVLRRLVYVALLLVPAMVFILPHH